MNATKEKNVLKIAGLFFVGTVLFLAVFSLVGFGQIVITISQMYVPYYMLAILLIISSILVWALRWSLFVKVIHPESNYFELLKNLLVGLAMNNITPVFKMGGEAARVYLLKVRHGIRGREGLATVSSDLTIELIVDILLAMVAVILLMVLLSPPVWLYGILVVFLVMSFIILFGIVGIYTGQGVIHKIINWCCGKIKRLGKYRETIINKYDTFQANFRNSLSNKKVFAGATTLTVLRKVITVVKYYVLFAAFGYEIGIVAILIAVGVGYMLMMVPATPGSLGIFEGGMVSVFVILGVPAGTAAAVVFLDRLIWFWAVTGIGSTLGTYYGLDILGGELFNRKNGKDI